MDVNVIYDVHIQILVIVGQLLSIWFSVKFLTHILIDIQNSLDNLAVVEKITVIQEHKISREIGGYLKCRNVTSKNILNISNNQRYFEENMSNSIVITVSVGSLASISAKMSTGICISVYNICGTVYEGINDQFVFCICCRNRCIGL